MDDNKILERIVEERFKQPENLRPAYDNRVKASMRDSYKDERLKKVLQAYDRMVKDYQKE